ncbi:hypothetical protein B9Z44_08595 [Limnohabitans curvus]|uniref:Uncharacterized protein n=1 Tax=Limnohabitans curvus TaxID=323423 RepID=A0A315ENY7_9BURK|nr:O-antigen polymerase [Limnohabitans curvus]PUE59626.1 hypothetical protein B9Z44_08595 [Limnohabitans curvus]
MLSIFRNADKPYFWLIGILMPTVPLVILFSANFEYFLTIISFFSFEIFLCVFLLSGPRVAYCDVDAESLVGLVKFLLFLISPVVIYPIYELIIGVSHSGASAYLLESRVKMLEGQGSQFGYFVFFLLKIASILVLILTYFENKLSIYSKFSICIVVIAQLSEGGRSFAFFILLSVFFIQMCKKGFPVIKLFFFSIVTIVLFSMSMPVFRLDVPLTFGTFSTGLLWFFGYSIAGFLSFEHIYNNDIQLYWRSFEALISSMGSDAWHEYIIDPYVVIPGDMEINTFSAYGLYFNYFGYGILIFLIAKTLVVAFFYRMQLSNPVFQLIYILLLASYPMIGLTDYFVDNLYLSLQLLIMYKLLRLVLVFRSMFFKTKL